ncbi:energy transducer TonB [Saccharicrinis aurantiacus]|uniref:energy transducer TonB n=1 Tax=Saccharicrinis aurantiacus TaxID=1849719 RepID=UPI00094F72E7|nr:energy transducer TonB [Saccharicrinis aurantiacus]
MKTRVLMLIVSILIFVSPESFSQNPINFQGEIINYIDDSGLKQGIWKIYSLNDNRAPISRSYVECEFVDDELDGNIYIRKGKKTIIEIRPQPNSNAASFSAQKGSKSIEGLIVALEGKGISGMKKIAYLDNEGNEFSKEIKDWLRSYTFILPSHYGGETGVQKSIRKIFEYDNVENCKGRVYVSFVVDSSGFIINPKASKVKNTTPNENGLLEKEAIRIIRNLPRMQPAFQGFMLGEINYTIPVNF